MEHLQSDETFRVTMIDSRDRRILLGQGFTQDFAKRLADTTPAKFEGTSRVVIEPDAGTDNGLSSDA